jgi:hypothetical protein
MNRTILTVLTLIFGVWGFDAYAENTYSGTVARSQLLVTGVPAEIDRFWRRTSYPKSMNALVSVRTIANLRSAVIGISPTNPRRYRDTLPLAQVKPLRYQFSGMLLPDSGWSRLAEGRIRLLPSQRMRLRIQEIATNDEQGYRIEHTYSGVLSKRSLRYLK